MMLRNAVRMLWYVDFKRCRKGGGAKMFITNLCSTIPVGITGESSQKGVDVNYK